MSGNCSGNCSGCKENCSEKDLHLPQNQYSNIKKVIGVVSGKGGVGKSLVTSLLATSTSAKGKSTAILDADITGPSIPKSFGVHGLAEKNAMGLLPKETATMGIKIMSVNLLLEKEESPVVWRGPVISGLLQQFWTDVAWGDVDYMFIDMPPGTGDVPLTVFQSIPLDGIVIVTTPQDLVHMIVKKAYNMAQQMNIPILGIIENMSGFVCPDCGKTYEIFGKSKVDEIAKELNIPVLAKLPIRSNITALVDKGAVELAEVPEIESATEAIMKV